MRRFLRLLPLLGAALLGHSCSAQAVLVPATATVPAHTTYIFWSCRAKAVPVVPGADSALPPAPSPPPPEPLVNGRFYRECTGKERFATYDRDTIGIRAFLAAGVRSGIEQLDTVPTGWGQDFPGYTQRYGSAFGEAAINNTVRYTLAAALHEDVRYLYCHHCTFGGKVQNALLSEFTARHGADGHRVFSVTPIIASVSGPLISYSAWYPPGYDAQLALKHSALGFGTRIGFRVLQEFVFVRDTKQEKAAAESARDVAAAKSSSPK